VADAVARALFVAHFEAGDDISDADVLVKIAEGAGIDGALVRDLLAGDADRTLIEDQAERARDSGITGVPSFVLNGKLLVVGAQPPAALASALEQSAQLASAPPA
jgi:predicted DsbA family dithiol-disulfide isomerase